jgi:hypothetical protein
VLIEKQTTGCNHASQSEKAEMRYPVQSNQGSERGDVKKSRYQ